MKTIVVPTDFSEVAEKALLLAKSIAQKTKATIHLANFYSIPLGSYAYPDISVPGEIIEGIRKASEEGIEKMAQELATEGFTVEHTVAMGMAPDEIVDLADKVDADLIVMGTTGAEGLMNKIIGSNAERVMQLTKRPIILVPKDCTFDGIYNIVYLDELKEDDTSILSKLFSFSEEIGVHHVKLLNINTGFFFQPVNEHLLIQLDRAFDLEKIKLDTVDAADVKEGIDKYLENEMIDLVVMSTHKKTLVERIFSKSNTNTMALYSKVPLMVYHK
jgi:nucleotide-binding universal stress UspA family protein